MYIFIKIHMMKNEQDVLFLLIWKNSEKFSRVPCLAIVGYSHVLLVDSLCLVKPLQYGMQMTTRKRRWQIFNWKNRAN